MHFEARIQSGIFRWVFNVLLAVIIFYNAEIGRLLGLTGVPLAISVVWPATGFALAALLLFGYNAWPGIFIGNLAYNFLHLYLNGHTFAGPFTTAIFISFGSLLQALVGASIMRRFASINYFSTVKDIFVFLVPAGLATCLIASTIGVIALTLYGSLSLDVAFNTWLTFWVGDTMGVYIFTPLLVVWSLQRPMVHFSDYRLEAIGMIASIITLMCLTFLFHYPLTQLYIPLTIWITYRFRMHGATLAIFLFTFSAVIATSFGYGTFAQSHNPLMVLITYLEVVVAIALILASVLNEREAAWNVLKSQNIDLKQAIDMHTEEIQDIHNQMHVKDKFASALGALTSGVARQIHVPLSRLAHFIKASQETLNHMQSNLSSYKDQLEQATYLYFEQNFKVLDGYLQTLAHFEDQADKIAQIVQEQSTFISTGRKVKSIDINNLLEQCIANVTAHAIKQYKGFTFSVLKEFDPNVQLRVAFPEDLAYAFIHLMHLSISSMHRKSLKNPDYKPTLEISTKDRRNDIAIVMRDNGDGIAEASLKNLFQTFVGAGPAEITTAINLSLVHDIIEHVHEGELSAESIEGEYLLIIAVLPKS